MDSVGPALRIVVLQYDDGAADLVLVAHRAVLDPMSLQLIGEVLTNGAHPLTVSMGEAENRPVANCGWLESVHAGPIDWATPTMEAGATVGALEVELWGTSEGAAAKLAVAAGLVQSRFEAGRPVTVAVTVKRPDRLGRSLGAFTGSSVLVVDSTSSDRTSRLLTSAQRVLDGSEQCDSRHTDTCLSMGESPVVVGLLCDALEPSTAESLPTLSAPWPLTLVPRGTPGMKVSLQVLYRTGEVGRATAQRFASCLTYVFQQLSEATAELSGAKIEILEKVEIDRQSERGRPVASLSPWQPERIDTAFEACAAQHPDAVAVISGAVSWTYRQLDERASCLAAGLISMGVSPGSRVGICLDRSGDLIASLIATLKADAVYVPMDPGHPADRLAETVEDAGLRIVVTDVHGFPATEGVRLASPADLVGEPGDVPQPPRRGPEDAAYVIYTSGSTGRPKGVVVPHRNVLALIAATRADFGLGPHDTWTLFHSSAFDFSVWEMWGALLTGAKLVVVDYWTSRSPEDLHALLREQGVTVLNQTPSAFAQLTEVDRRQEGELAVRLVVLGGESLDPRGLLGWFDRYPEHRCRLVNMFGITETTVHVTTETITRKDAVTGSRSVGRPLPGWFVQVLDEQGCPVPDGVAGEIHVGGEGLALEYLGRPELTAERFIRDPRSGARVYRSGDRGRFLPDGRIEHLGRLDNQVKLRGFRIELDEIRAVLLGDPAVASAAVVLGGREDEDASRARLDSYVVLNGKESVDWLMLLRARAARLLPEYMVPATYTAVSRLPLTANGKLDVKKLSELSPAPVSVAATIPRVDEDVREAKQEGLESALAEVWESVLGVQVGPNDNFFELGGNSLSAVRTRVAMRQSGLPELTLRELYLTPTVRALAALLGERLTEPT
ncbi:amino acid adenylation domain-containing protein [Streptomyces sp. NPDC087908]|uniref:non-ribosomal peptide synthetase n=1 Tax=Streptomyces sp. NPDC087908 TaxID=3365820 RepID=UPI0037FFD587